MAEQENNSLTPAVCVYHDGFNYSIEVELPGAEKEDIDFQISENWFCLKAPAKDGLYSGCWVLAHDVKPEKAKAKLEEDVLSIQVPLEGIATQGMKIAVE